MIKEKIADLLKEAMVEGFRNKVLATGLARGLIWRDGVVPEDSPNFPAALSEDLLEYGYSLLSLCIRYKKEVGIDELYKNGLLRSGEAIEAAVRKGENTDNRGFHIIASAAAYHLAGYSARAYCMVNEKWQNINLTKFERVLYFFFKRDFTSIRDSLESLINAPEMQDDSIEELISSNDLFDENDIMAIAIEANLLKAFSWFEFAIKTGHEFALERANEIIMDGLEIASEFSNVTMWWHHLITLEIFNQLWSFSFHKLLSPIEESEEWNIYRKLFISSLYTRSTSEIDLWPSQVAAVERSRDIKDNLVVTLPTSAGKTRVAELCILRCLAESKRVVYVTPLRALSAQTERTLSRSFNPLGSSVSNLYGSMGATSMDVDSLKNRNIVVSTPEKLDFAIRNNPEILDDVGLIVLDEGHLIGLGEREIRYEILIQRILNRSDADDRRIVCLSAILPEGEDLKNFVEWLRRDLPGQAVVSKWKPNRHRIGVLKWQSNYVTLDFAQTPEKPFIKRFVQAQAPQTKMRKNDFPQNKNEMILASSWKLADEDHTVLIYCPLKKSVEPLAALAIKLAKQKHLPSLLKDQADVKEAILIGEEWLGADHVAVQSLKLGVVVHHGQLPRPFQAAVESLINKKICKIIVSSPTLAQGLNISASALIVHSLYRNRKQIPASEFTNVVGRSGRAFVDIDGLVLFPIFEQKQRDTAYQESVWHEYVSSLTDRNITSGLLLLVKTLIDLIGNQTGTSQEVLLEYVLNSDELWSCPVSESDKDAYEEEDLIQVDPKEQWEEYLSFLDTAILALVEDLSCESDQLADLLEEILHGSLWKRQIGKVAEEYAEVYEAILLQRASYIWDRSTVSQRQSFHAAGVGLSTGSLLIQDEDLKSFLAEANSDMEEANFDSAIENILKIATVVFEIREFRPYKMCDQWQQVLTGWLKETPMADLILIGGEHTVQFISDAISYKLVWAIEAIRFMADGADVENSDTRLSTALESGSLNISVCLLLQSGLTSRMAASLAVSSEGVNFETREAMWFWLFSSKIRELSKKSDWPSPLTEAEWKRFYNFSAREKFDVISEQVFDMPCQLIMDTKVSTGDFLRVHQAGEVAQLLTPDFATVGSIPNWKTLSEKGNIWAQKIDEDIVRVYFYGPSVPLDFIPFDPDWTG